MTMKALLNVFADIPFNSDPFGRRVAAETEELLVMQIALHPGQEVPRHRANSNVHLLVITGEIQLELADEESLIKAGDLVPVDFQTPMRLRNSGDVDASFLVFKAPHPRNMKE